MHHRLIAILAIVCFAFSAAGCEALYRASLPKSKPARKKKEKVQRERKQYETVVMPLQTGSTLQRRMFVEKKAKEDDDEPASKKKAKKKESPTPTPTPKPAVEPADTPPPTQEPTPEPTPERFR